MNKRFSLLFTGVCLFCLNTSNGQSIDSLRKLFPGEQAVLLNKTLEYNISMLNGQPHVESHESQQIEYLLGSATAYMGQYGFSHSDFQQLVSYDAYTRTPRDEKLKVSEFKTSTDKQNFVFYDDVKTTTFDFPAVETGAVGNLNVSWLNKDPYLLAPYFFPSYIPAIKSELKITVAKDITLKYRLMGLDTTAIQVKKESRHRNNIFTFVYSNCPADKNYDNAPGASWYLPHVIFYIDHYKDDNGTSVSFLSNLDDLYRLSYSYIKSVNTKTDPTLRHIADSLTSGLTTTRSKAMAIYSWVQHNIKYVAFENGMGGFVPRDAGLVCTRRYGDCKDMASILTEMLKTEGVDAHFTWIGTRDLPYKFTETPLPLVSDHMICTIKLDNKYIFLDGTDPTCVFGMPSAGIQGKQAMIAIDDKNYKILNVPIIDKRENTVTDTTWLQLTPDGIKGKIKRMLTGYCAMDMYGKLMYWKEDDMKQDMQDEFERGSNKFQLDTFMVKRQPANDAITVLGQFSLPDYATKAGSDYYLNLNLFKFFVNQKIDYPRRKVPIAHDFESVKKYVTMLKIPEGYKVTYLPKSESFHNKVWGFDLKYEQKGTWVVLSQEFDTDYLLLTNDKFAAWNQVLAKLYPLYEETLSLSKN